MPILTLRRTAATAATGLVLALAGCSEPTPVERMLPLVPADSPYVFVSSKPMPEPLYSDLMAMGEAELQSSLRRWQELAARSAQRPEGAPPDMDKATRVIEALAAELDGAYSAEGSRTLGFGADSQAVFYGLGVFPVLRTEVLDPAKVEALIARVEARSELAAPRGELNGLDYRRIPLGEEMLLVIALQDRDLVISLLPTVAADDLLPLVFGFDRPAASLGSGKTLAELQKRYGFQGYGEGYLDLRQLLRQFTGRGEGPAGAALRSVASELPTPSPACLGLLDKFADGVPRLAAGITDVQKKSYQMTAAYETSSAVSAQLQKLARAKPLPGMGVADDAMFSLGVDMDVPAVREGIKTLLRFVAAQGAGCEWVDAQAIQANLPKIDFMLGPMLGGLSGAYAQLADLSFDAQTLQPGQVRGGVLLAVSDPRGMVAMAAMMNPEMGQIELPADGSAVAVPGRLLPPQVPPLHLAAGDGLLAVASGDDGGERAEAMLKAARSAQPLLMTASYDLARFIGLMDRTMGLAAERLDAMGEAEQAAMMRDQLASMQAMAERFGRIEVSVAPETAGLVMKQRVELR